MKKIYLFIIILICIFTPIVMCINSKSSIHIFENWMSWGNWISGIVGCLSAILMYVIFKKQEISISKNHFESIYFEMLKFLHEMKPIEKIKEFKNGFMGHFILSCDLDRLSLPLIKASMIFIFRLHYRGKGLQTYLRFLHRITMFVEETSSLTLEQKQDYLKLLISQMSDDEILLVQLYIFLTDSEFKHTIFEPIIMSTHIEETNPYFDKIIDWMKKHPTVDALDINEIEKDISLNNFKCIRFFYIYKHIEENI